MNEQKNLLLAIVASLIILLIFQYLFPTERKMIEENVEAENQIKEVPQEKILDREEIVKNNKRIYFSNTSRIKGSISLKGARFDDVILKDYKENIRPESSQVTILSPNNTLNPYFVDFGWMSQQNIDLPNKNSIWELIEGKELGPESHITIKWTSPDGIEFFRKIEIDKDYLISIEQKVTNVSGKNISLTQYGRINRTGTPKTSGFYILHEGPIAVLNDRLIEIDYDDIIEEGSKTLISKGGWVGITDKYWLAALIPDQKSRVEAGFKAVLKNIERYQAQYTSNEIVLESGESTSIKSNLFIGAKEVDLLDKYSNQLSIEMFDRAVDFGWFYVITKPLFLLLHKLSDFLEMLAYLFCTYNCNKNNFISSCE